MTHEHEPGLQASRDGWKRGYEAKEDQVERLLEALRDIAAGPLDGDYDYSPGVSEQLRASEALIREQPTMSVVDVALDADLERREAIIGLREVTRETERHLANLRKRLEGLGVDAE